MIEWPSPFDSRKAASEVCSSMKQLAFKHPQFRKTSIRHTTISGNLLQHGPSLQQRSGPFTAMTFVTALVVSQIYTKASGGLNRMAYVIAEPCIGVKDAACVDACPVDCIHPRKNEDTFETEMQLYIDPVECIDCGACVPVCPVSAIFALDDLPEKWKQFAEMNANHYAHSHK